MRYNRRDKAIEAFQLPPSGDFNLEPFFKWANEVKFVNFHSERDEVMTMWNDDAEEIQFQLEPGDWIVKEAGKFYPVAPDEFERVFEPFDPWSELTVLEMQEECWNRVWQIWREEEGNPNRKACWFARVMGEFQIRNIDSKKPLANVPG